MLANGKTLYRFPIAKQEDAQVLQLLWYRRNPSANSSKLVRRKTLVVRSWTVGLRFYEGKRKVLNLRCAHPAMASLLAFWWRTSIPQGRDAKVEYWCGGIQHYWASRSLAVKDPKFYRRVQKLGKRTDLPF